MTILQQAITIVLCALGTLLHAPFLVFSPSSRNTFNTARLGAAGRDLRYARCLLPAQCRRAALFPRAPELIAIAVTIGLHLWKKQMLLSIAGGTVCYVLLVQFVF